MRYSWSIPETAKPGDEYTIEVTIDTGMFAGKIVGAQKIVIGPASSDADAENDGSSTNE